MGKRWNQLLALAGLKDVSTPRELDRVLRGGSSSQAGMAVSIETASRLASVYICRKVISEAFAMLPFHMYQKPGRDTVDHQVAELYREAPNSWQTPFEYFEMQVSNLVMRGNYYSFINRVRGEIRELIPLNPDSMEIVGVDGNPYEYFYRMTTNSGQKDYPRNVIHHVKLNALDGRMGVSPIEQNRNAIGVSMAVERYNAVFFKNQAKPSGIITHPKVLNDDAFERLKREWNEMYSGDNTHRTALLEDGVQFQAVSLNNEQSQFLETRKMTTRDIFAIFGVPVHRGGDLENAHFNNLESQNIEFAQWTMLPIARRIEQATRRDLMTKADRGAGLYGEFAMEVIMRGDLKSRLEAYAIAILNGVMNPNEARAKENMPPYEGGNEYRRPSNTETPGGNPAVTAPMNEDTAKAVTVAAKAIVGELMDELFGAGGAPLLSLAGAGKNGNGHAS